MKYGMYGKNSIPPSSFMGFVALACHPPFDYLANGKMMKSEFFILPTMKFGSLATTQFSFGIGR